MQKDIYMGLTGSTVEKQDGQIACLTRAQCEQLVTEGYCVVEDLLDCMHLMALRGECEVGCVYVCVVRVVYVCVSA
jgi:hypothetical protein